MSFISRLLPNPPGPDGEGEWIEICFDKEVSSLYVADQSSDPLPIIRKEEDECEKFYKEETRITLNNDKDTIYLLKDNETEDSCSYTSAKEGEIILCREEMYSDTITKNEAQIISVEESVIQDEMTLGDVIITGIFVACFMTGIIVFFLIKNGALLFKKTLDKE